MPIPLFFIAAGTLSGAVGLGKSVKAFSNQQDAKEKNEYAKEIVDKASSKMRKYRDDCSESIENLGDKKIYILDESIKPFIHEFEKINHIEFTESKGLNELQNLIIDKKSFTQLKELQSVASSIAGGIFSGSIAGTLTAFGAYGAASTLATASTGTAIASLHGAAATNATLAFFGGGSLATGGLGMAGGTMVLGGLVAGPALAVLGVIAESKTSKNRDNAYSNFAQARKYSSEMDVACQACESIRRRCNMFSRFLIMLDAMFEPMIYEMKEIIRTKGTDYRNYSKSDREIIAGAMSLAGAIKSLLDTPILDEDGNLNPDSLTMIGKIHNTVKDI